MIKLIYSRFLQGIVVLLVVSVLIFALLASAGGDAVSGLRDDSRISDETIAELRRVYGLDQPLAARYLNWLGDAIRGRWGHSFALNAPVGSLIRPRLLHTLALALAALAIAWTIALSLGITAARRAGGLIDRACEALVLLASSTPRLALALATLAFAVRTAWFTTGSAPTDQSMGRWLLRLAPPAFVLSFPLIALFLAQTRATLGSALKEDYVRVARAKGLSERAILFRHALRPSLNPLITVLGSSLGNLVGGSVLVEKTLGWPGLGQLSAFAVQGRDAPLLMGVVMITSTAVLAGNLFADILLRWNDPRLGK